VPNQVLLGRERQMACTRHVHNDRRPSVGHRCHHAAMGGQSEAECLQITNPDCKSSYVGFTRMIANLAPWRALMPKGLPAKTLHARDKCAKGARLPGQKDCGRQHHPERIEIFPSQKLLEDDLDFRAKHPQTRPC